MLGRRDKRYIISRMMGGVLPPFLFDTSLTTFTAGMAKRTGPGPFAAAPAVLHQPGIRFLFRFLVLVHDQTHSFENSSFRIGRFDPVGKNKAEGNCRRKRYDIPGDHFVQQSLEEGNIVPENHHQGSADESGQDSSPAGSAPVKRQQQRRSEGRAQSRPGIEDHVVNEIIRPPGQKKSDDSHAQGGPAADGNQLALGGVRVDQAANPFAGPGMRRVFVFHSA